MTYLLEVSRIRNDKYTLTKIWALDLFTNLAVVIEVANKR